MNKVIVAPKSAHGPLAQLGERLHGMEEVIGSIPTRSTIDSYRFPMLKNIPEDSKSLIKANGFTGWDE